MSKYSGKKVTLPQSAENIYAKISDFTAMKQRIEQLPPEIAEKLQGARFESDSITLPAPQIGELTFKIADRVPNSLVRLQAVNSPVPFGINLNLNSVSDSSTEFFTDLEIELPAMLRPLVGGKLAEAADKFSDMFANIFK